jgi:hypothetical protein
VPNPTLLAAVCEIPASFYAREDISFSQLVRDSGVASLGSEFTSDALVPLLDANPGLIDAWLLWSANKRVSSGWYFQRAEDSYIVGFYPAGEPLRFENASRGCAEFIVREVSQIMRSNNRRSGRDVK